MRLGRSRSRPLRALLASVMLVAMTAGAPATLSAGGDYYEAPEAPFNMTVVGHDGGLISSIEDIDGTLYALQGQGLNVYDGATSGDLALLGSAAVPEIGGKLFADIASDRMFVVGSNGFSAIDISVDASPTLLGSWDMPSADYGIVGFYVVGDYAYAGYDKYGSRGIKIFDVSDSTHPNYITAVGLPLGDLEPEVVGALVYAQTETGFIVIDNTEPLSPDVIADPRSAGIVTGLEISGTDIFVSYAAALGTGAPGGFEVYSTTDPELLVDRVVASEAIIDIAVAGDSLWLLGNSGVAAYYEPDATAIPEYKGELAAIPGATEIECNGVLGAVLSRTESPLASLLSGIDGTASGAPVVHDTIQSTAGDNALVFGEGVAYVAGDFGVRSLDVSDPSAAVELDRLDVGVSMDVAIFGDTVYSARAESVAVVDVTDPASMSAVTSYATTYSGVNRIAAGDGVLFAATDDGLEILDVSDAAGAGVDTLATYSTSQPAWDVELVGDRLVLAFGPDGWNESAALLFDVSDPALPVLLDDHGLPGGSPEISVYDNMAYIGLTSPDWGGSAVKMFDLSEDRLDYTKYQGVSKWGVDDIAAVPTGFIATGQQTERWNLEYADMEYMDGYLPLGAARMDISGDLIALVDEVGGVTFVMYEEISGRSFGASRFDTAVSVSKEFASASTVILATGRSFPDALAGAPLAYALDAPILLVDTSYVPQVVLDEIARLGATDVVIIGGEGAVSNDVVEQLVAAGIVRANIKRIYGASRYETCKNIALELEKELGEGTIDTAFIATGANFPDALAASGLAAKMGAPILLVGSTVPAATSSALTELGITDTLVLGGEFVVTPAVTSQLPSPERLSGTSRYDTAKDIADFALDSSGAGFTAVEVFVATGANFPDALGAGVLAAMKGAPTVLTDPAVHPATRNFLVENRESIERLVIIGGTIAIPSSTERTLVSLIP